MNQLLLLAALPGALLAQALEGIWQGALTPNPNLEIRMVFRITKDDSAHQGMLYNLAAGRQFNLGAVALQGNTLKIAIPGLGPTYEGKFGAEGNSIDGTLTQGTNPLPLPLKRATTETAWELPPPPTARKPLPEGTKLEFEIATIKPGPEGQQVGGFNVTATELRGRNSLADLITFPYVLHRSQVSGLPGWAETERYDIAARLPEGGDPSDSQIRTMLQNLIQSRFGLSFHTESVSFLCMRSASADKGGRYKNREEYHQRTENGRSRSRQTAFSRCNDGRLGEPVAASRARPPVIDQYGLTDRFDFTLNWTPDEFQFPRASAAQRAAVPTNPEAPPDLFTAFQEQLGMKLEAKKAPTDIVVIDKVSKPSEN
jgi:uncharacterized protein (TIGR03435 family)